MKHKHRIISYLLLLVLVVIFILAVKYVPGLGRFASPEYVKGYLQGLGWWGWLMYIALLALSVPLPIPSTVVILGGGYVYGAGLGTILSLIGVVLGAVMAFYLVRLLGEPVLELVIDKHHITHFNHIFKKYELKAALVSYAIPVFPSDILGFLLGLTEIKFGAFFSVVVLGNLPRTLITAVLGSDLYQGFSLRTMVILGVCVVWVVIALFREKIKKLVFKEIKILEEEAVKVEEAVAKKVREKRGLKGARRKRRSIRLLG